jgi:hypothetical protein
MNTILFSYVLNYFIIIWWSSTQKFNILFYRHEYVVQSHDFLSGIVWYYGKYVKIYLTNIQKLNLIILDFSTKEIIC